MTRGVATPRRQRGALHFGAQDQSRIRRGSTLGGALRLALAQLLGHVRPPLLGRQRYQRTGVSDHPFHLLCESLPQERQASEPGRIRGAEQREKADRGALWEQPSRQRERDAYAGEEDREDETDTRQH